MKITYTKQFIKDVKKYPQFKKQVGEILSQFEQSKSFYDISNIKKLQSKDQDFRLRMGSFRLGFSQKNDTIIFRRFLHRKDIYKFFP